MVAKNVCGVPVTCKGLVWYFKTYIDIFKGNALPDPNTVFEATAKLSNESAVEEASAKYRNLMDKACGLADVYVEQDQLMSFHYEYKHLAITYFKVQPKMGGNDFSQSYLLQLGQQLDQLFVQYHQQNDQIGIIAKQSNESAVDAACKKYRNSMDEICGPGKPYVEQEQLKNYHSEYKQLAINLFQVLPKWGGNVYAQSNLVQLEQQLNQLFAQYLQQNEQRQPGFRNFVRQNREGIKIGINVAGAIAKLAVAIGSAVHRR
jgi:hypothetical protein